jgi:8-oxo-dGTP pyrophosphatase MutT (NUDIX family)
MFAQLLSRSRQGSEKSEKSAGLGVRGLILDANGRIFLVRHRFVAGWHLPGGRVGQSESALMALARELEERGGIIMSGDPNLHGLFFNASARENIACYVVRNFRHQPQPDDFDVTTAQAGFFPPAQLPAARSRATSARVGEVLNGLSIAQTW